MSPDCIFWEQQCPGTAGIAGDKRTPGARPSSPSSSSTQMKLRSLVHILKPSWDPGRSERGWTGLRSHHSSAGSFLHHPATWARAKGRAETSGGSRKSSSNFSSTNISLGGAWTACGPVLHPGLKLILWAEHLTWFQRSPGISIGLHTKAGRASCWWRAPSSLSSLFLASEYNSSKLLWGNSHPDFIRSGRSFYFLSVFSTKRTGALVNFISLLSVF